MAEDGPASPFALATSVLPQGRGRFAVDVDPAWSGGAGPHGGYLAATILRGLQAEVDDPASPVRSLTCHYLSSPTFGPAEVEVVVRKKGRTVIFASAELRQGDRTCVLATATFARSGPALLDYDHCDPPDAVPRGSAPRLEVPGLPSLFDQLDLRVALSSPDGQATAGGWVGFTEPTVLDAAALCLFADCWLPAPAAGLGVVPSAPTLTYSIFFRREPRPDDNPVLLQITSKCSTEGLFEEDGTLWGSGGLMLAQSRQLALLR